MILCFLPACRGCDAPPADTSGFVPDDAVGVATLCQLDEHVRRSLTHSMPVGHGRAAPEPSFLHSPARDQADARPEIVIGERGAAGRNDMVPEAVHVIVKRISRHLPCVLKPLASSTYF